MNDPDTLLSGFEAGQIDASEFPHERHVRVTWALAQRYPPDEALRRLIAGIRGIATRAGHPDAYHETVTRAWFELIASADDLDHHPELFDKNLLGRHYSPERLALGREHWQEPDLHPLRLPAPEQPPLQTDLAAVLRRVPTAVAILAAHAGDTVRATTVSSITSVSRDPALVGVCLANGSRTLDLVRSAQSFALSVLAADQDDLAARFAEAERPAGPGQFAGVPHHLSPSGPVIDAAAAWIGCSVHSIHRCGDHHIVLGEVDLAVGTDRNPLVRHDGAYHEGSTCSAGMYPFCSSQWPPSITRFSPVM
jgi:flavin reductase (DIM6/NTAB) family NADH-FMN oxidoreductase RutF